MLPAERVGVNYSFLFLDVYVERVCLEKMMVKHGKAVLGRNLREAKEKRGWWRKPQINVKEQRNKGMKLKELEGEGQQEGKTD